MLYISLGPHVDVLVTILCELGYCFQCNKERKQLGGAITEGEVTFKVRCVVMPVAKLRTPMRYFLYRRLPYHFDGVYHIQMPEV